MAAIWICIRFPRLGVEIQPSLDPSQPRAVIERGRVRLVNAAAETEGIGPGLRTATAYGICPALEVLEADPELESRRLLQLAELAREFSPGVSIEAGSVLLEVAGSLHLFDGLRGIARRLRHRYRQLGHATAFGFAHTPLAATVLARAGQPSLSDCPDRLRDKARRLLQRLPVEYLEPVPKLDTVTANSTLSSTLSTMGIRTIGQLLALPRAPLNRRFGPALLAHLDRLTGKRPDPRKPLPASRSFHREAHFLEDIPERAALLFPMQRMLTELECWLTAHQLAAARLHWAFSHDAFGSVRMAVRMATPGTNAQHFLALTRLTLERTELPERVASLVLHVRQPAANSPATQALFDNLDMSQTQPSRELLDLLQARLGLDSLCHLASANDHRPEHAWRVAPVHGDNVIAAPAAVHRTHPVWLLSSPEPVNARQLRILRGPERIHTGWWEGRLADAPAPRDYYAAQQPSGALCWVFRVPSRRTTENAPDGEWFIHGWFG